jgi:hypothetical protein
MPEVLVEPEKDLGRGLAHKEPDCGRNPYRCAMEAFDYSLLGVLAFLLIPAYLIARLPLRIDFTAFAGFFWVISSIRSALVAMLLVILGLPPKKMLLPALRRYWNQKFRILFALAIAIELMYACGFSTGLIIAVDALALAELMERRRAGFERALIDFFWPGLYLFCTLIVVFALNAAMVGIRYFGMYGQTFKHLDWILFHVNVSSLSHWTLSHSPQWFAKLLDFSYFGMFSQLGATLFLTALLGNQRHAVRYVRALLLGYTIALAIYFVFPAKGPYFICPDHQTNYPHNLMSYNAQEGLLNDAQMLWTHKLPPGASTFGGYYISFPCMHIALALISFWFLLPWRRIAGMVLAFDVMLLAPAIILLEWHYLIDMFGGVATAALAIWISNRVSRKSDTANLPDHSRELASAGTQ